MVQNNSSRRKFLKKNVLAGAFIAAGGPLLYANSSAKVKLPTPFKTAENYNEIDWDAVRSAFLFDEDKNYFNVASLGPSPRSVIDTICNTMRDLETICSHGHHMTENTHLEIAKFLNVEANEIAITRNATEGMNIMAKMLRLKAGDEVILTKEEHVGGAAPWLALQENIGIKVVLVDMDYSGETNLKRITDKVTSKTKAIMFSHITCTTGMRLPVKEIAAFCRKNNIYSCVDGAQALGMFPIDLTDLDPDFYTASGHKWLLGPKGTGVLYIRTELIKKLKPVFTGAYTVSDFDLQEMTFTNVFSAQREEYGTRNTSIILGIETAIEFISTIGIENVGRRGLEFATYFRQKIKDLEKVEILTPENPAFAASIITIRIAGVDNLELNMKISVDHGIRLRGIYENDINGIRISFCVFNTYKEVDNLVKVIREVAS
ncbi:aminotransferase class V-fold PLP-dependent enzyme [Crocinitomix catalasitica]|uniref:aminotransferase class V-fold PLP-dependent enzyme n=1 Tax=Crocinitomix catalasitica TaxID=184607 RepID=UPI000484EE3F|nr:aminotransferase class V-fold PLP-dependent enzyme [Crocinitomix catalasitica]